MYILGINTSHHGSICLLKDGEVVLFLEEERTSRKKYSYITTENCSVFSTIKKYTDKVDYICFGYGISIPKEFCGMHDIEKFKEIANILVYSEDYTQYCLPDQTKILNELSKVSDTNTKFSLVEYSHHNFHAAQSFYNSGFEEAICIVIDGQGCFSPENPKLFERESIYKFSYPNSSTQLYCNYDSEGNGIGSAYSRVTGDIGFTGGFEEGKTMGLSSYKPHNMEDPTMMVNVAKANAVQLGTQEEALKLILYSLTLSDSKNICISGGYGLNCVSNYYFRKNLPPDINLYCEPIANDAGQSIGIAKFIHHYLTGDKTIRPQKSIYYGPTPEYWNDTLAKTPLKPN